MVASLAALCRDTGIRLTFFVNGVNKSWSVNAPALRPMVDSGQIQLANHTWSHPDIARLATADVVEQIRNNGTFLRNTYGVDGTPFFRPPYGHHTPLTDQVAADLGYTAITMWNASVRDSRPLSETQFIANAINAFQPQHIVIAHANLPTITHCYSQLAEIIRSRNLQTVTLNDVFV